MKLVSLTTSASELRELVPLLRDLYFTGAVELLSLVNSEAEAKLRANLACHRQLREFSCRPLEAKDALKDKELLAAARNALLEERPDVVLWPKSSFLQTALQSTLRQLGIGEYQLGDKGNRSLTEVVNSLRTLSKVTKPAHSGQVKATDFLESHWEALGAHLTSPCLLKTTPQIEEICRQKFPEVEFHTESQVDRYSCGLNLLGLSFSEAPSADIEALRAQCTKLFSLEPVNSTLAGSRYNFCYGDYDNEFALKAPELDLKEHFGSGHETVVWQARSGQAGPHPSPHPDGLYPAFFTTWPGSESSWTSRFNLPDKRKLKIVFADSGNVAASALHHADAVNRFTDSQAWAVTGLPHPFIGPQEPDEHCFFVQGKFAEGQPSAELKRVLEEADCVVFFEDDDEQSPNWSFPFHEYVKSAAIVHLYIGYRVHQKCPRLMREGRTVLTPLPHLLRMYPNSHFYAGFPPLSLLERVVCEPGSAEDATCRFLHTPSLPHWTTSHFPYHKDTEAFLRVARILKKKHKSKVEFHQVGGWSHCEVLCSRQYCDVTFNQLRGFMGLSGDEAMMLSRPCVQAFDQFNTNRHLEYWGLDADFPWVSCTRENLCDVFEELLLSPEKRQEIGVHSRQFMMKYFSPQKGILPLLYHCYRAVNPERG